MDRHYWRIDEIDSEGNVTKGKVMWFDVVHLAFPTAEGYFRFAKLYDITTFDNKNRKRHVGY